MCESLLCRGTGLAGLPHFTLLQDVGDFDSKLPLLDPHTLNIKTGMHDFRSGLNYIYVGA